MMVNRRRCTLLSACIAISGVIGCGGSQTKSTPSHAQRQAAQQQQAKAKAKATYQRCQRLLGPLMQAERSLDGHLDVGMNYHDYSSAVGDVNTAYQAIPVKQLGFNCELAGVPLETALNEYVKAQDVWTTCFNDINCNNDSIKSPLEKHWSKAHASISHAETALSNLKKPDSS